MHVQLEAERLHGKIMEIIGEILGLASLDQEAVAPTVQIKMLHDLNPLIVKARESGLFPGATPIFQEGGHWGGIFAMAERTRGKDRVSLWHAVQDLLIEVNVLNSISL